MELISIFPDYSRAIACCSVTSASSAASHVFFYMTLPRIYHNVFQQRRSVMFGTQRLPPWLSLSALNLFILSSSFSWIRLCYFPAFHVKDRILFSFPSSPLSYCHCEVSLWNLRALRGFMPRSPVSSATWRGRRENTVDCQSGRAEEGRVTRRLHYDISDSVVKNRAELSALMHQWC